MGFHDFETQGGEAGRTGDETDGSVGWIEFFDGPAGRLGKEGVIEGRVGQSELAGDRVVAGVVDPGEQDSWFFRRGGKGGEAQSGTLDFHDDARALAAGGTDDRMDHDRCGDPPSECGGFPVVKAIHRGQL